MHLLHCQRSLLPLRRQSSIALLLLRSLLLVDFFQKSILQYYLQKTKKI